MYSKRNWIGLNPFPWISGIDARCQPGKSGSTHVIVKVNRERAFLYALFQFSMCGLGSAALPTLVDAILFIAFSSAVAWFGCMFVPEYLIKKEITNCLKA